ncbi:MAG: mechanosensitive ion channel [Bacteroidales bacterium]|nr:mechanosensitive ion channel [Bacteroidales bacterium]
MEKLLGMVKNWLVELGFGEHITTEAEIFIKCGIVLLISTILWIVLRIMLAFIKDKLLVHLKFSQKGKLYIITIFKRIISIIALVFLLQMLPEAFDEKSKALSWCLKIDVIAIIICSIAITDNILKICYDIISKKNKYKQKPIKGFLQILQIGIYFIGVILVVAAIIEKSPLGLLTGLGAFAAVLSFIFKDTILGFVAGIQLSYNDMVRPGDWIVIDNTLANGVVTDISLITVKIQNFDNTIINVPTYSLINTPFQNWRGMDESGGRRITLNFNIDMNSVRYCDSLELEKLSQYVIMPASKEKEQITNLQLYRMYLLKMILENPQINKELMVMIRYLQPGPQGIPVQIYCFSKNKSWVTYEGIQAAILEQAIASASIFGIKMFQIGYPAP